MHRESEVEVFVPCEYHTIILQSCNPDPPIYSSRMEQLSMEFVPVILAIVVHSAFILPKILAHLEMPELSLPAILKLH